MTFDLCSSGSPFATTLVVVLDETLSNVQNNRPGADLQILRLLAYKDGNLSTKRIILKCSALLILNPFDGPSDTRGLSL